MRGIRTAGACLASALLVAACGGQGTGPTDSAGGSSTATTSQTTPPVSPDKLNPGRYSTKPLAPMGKAGTPERGAVLQAQQMADYVVGPWEVDKAMIDPYLDTYYVMSGPAQLSSLGPQATADAATRHGMVNGFGSARENPDKAAMLNAVLRFPDPASATAASRDMNVAASAQPISGAQPEPVAIPGHQDAAASTYTYTPRDSDRPRTFVRAYTPHGQFVLMQFAQSVDGVGGASALVAKAIDLQGKLIDGFTPADVTALADVEVDPTGLLARTLPLPTAEASPIKNAVYGPRGASHFQSNPVASTTLFDDTRVTAVSMAGANVYEAHDNPSARMIINSFNQEVSGMAGATQAAPVPEIPESHCMAFPQAFYCVAPADKYAIEIRGAKFEDVQQQVAAQYIILTAK